MFVGRDEWVQQLMLGEQFSLLVLHIGNLASQA
jgi:hypothetical protein